MNSFFKKAVLCLCLTVVFTGFIGCVGHDNGTKSPTGTQQVDTDNDGIPNTTDTDIDGDGIPNDQDQDIDGDGTPNNQDATPNGPIDNSNTDPYISGLGVVAVDTFHYTFSTNAGQLTNTITSTQVINLQSVRDTIQQHEIALSTFSITGLSLIAQGANGFIQANSSAKIVVTMSYVDAANNKVLILESAAQSGLAGPVLTLGDLTNGIGLNHEIFSSNPGFDNFAAMIQDPSKTSVSTIIELKFLDNIPQPGPDINLGFAIRATGKKPF
jgi:hypothetical protein